MPLQISTPATPEVQVCRAPPTQFCTVTWQAPTPHVVLPSPLSTVPSQSSSRPLQVSAAASVPTHDPNIPLKQVSTPAPHAFVHARVTPLSTTPSQSSSMLLQVSAA